MAPRRNSKFCSAPALGPKRKAHRHTRFRKKETSPMSDKAHDEHLLDVALEQTFPASDAPSFMAGAAVAGAPRRGAAEPESLKSEPRFGRAGVRNGTRPVQ